MTWIGWAAGGAAVLALGLGVGAWIGNVRSGTRAAAELGSPSMLTAAVPAPAIPPKVGAVIAPPARNFTTAPPVARGLPSVTLPNPTFPRAIPAPAATSPLSATPARGQMPPAGLAAAPIPRPAPPMGLAAAPRLPGMRSADPATLVAPTAARPSPTPGAAVQAEVRSGPFVERASSQVIPELRIRNHSSPPGWLVIWRGDDRREWRWREPGPVTHVSLPAGEWQFEIYGEEHYQHTRKPAVAGTLRCRERRLYDLDLIEEQGTETTLMDLGDGGRRLTR